MSGHIVITQHDELPDAGTVEHEQLEDLLQGEIPEGLPEDFSIGIALLPENNVFSGVNSFDTLVVENLTVTSHNQVDINNLNVENPVIVLGHNMPDPVQELDRGLVFTSQGNNPSLFWDHDQFEFRLAHVDADGQTTEFPDPADPAQGGYANLHTADITAAAISAQAVNVNDISVVGAISTPELKVSSLKTLGGDDFLVSGEGIDIAANPDVPHQLVISRSNRIKESIMLESNHPAGAVMSFPGIDNILQFDNKSIDVFINGVMVLEGENFDYTISSDGIIFTFALEMKDAITITIG